VLPSSNSISTRPSSFVEMRVPLQDRQIFQRRLEAFSGPPVNLDHFLRRYSKRTILAWESANEGAASTMTENPANRAVNQRPIPTWVIVAASGSHRPF